MALVWTPASPGMAVGYYALEGIGELRVDGRWRAARASTDAAAWRFFVDGMFQKTARAARPTGEVVGECRGSLVHWRNRTFRLRRGLGRRAFVYRVGRFHLCEDNRIVARLATSDRPLHRIDIELLEGIELEPPLTLFVAFLVGRLANRDYNDDGV